MWPGDERLYQLTLLPLHLLTTHSLRGNRCCARRSAVGTSSNDTSETFVVGLEGLLVESNAGPLFSLVSKGPTTDSSSIADRDGLGCHPDNETVTVRPQRGSAMTTSQAFAFAGGRVVGIALVVLGVGSWVITDFASVTALIPAIFSILVVGLAAVGRETDRDDLAVYGIGVLGALAVLGSLRAVPDLLSLATGEPVDSTVATTSQGLTILLGLALVAVSVRAVLADR